MIYIFDVDGTILTTVDAHDYHNARPIPGRIERVNKLYESGNYIIYWTARGATTGQDWYAFTEKQLRDFGCRFNEFHTKKPHYHIWVDDKAQNARDFFKAT